MTKLITTPFGEIDVEATVTKHLVEATPYNTVLKAEWIGFEYLRLDMKEADILWKVSHFNSLGVKINDGVLSENIVRTHISNSNKVTSGGVTITHDSFPPTKSTVDGKEVLNYSAYNAAYAIGTLEFDYWLGVISKVPITIALDGAAPILKAGGKFREPKKQTIFTT